MKYIHLRPALWRDENLPVYRDTEFEETRKSFDKVAARQRRRACKNLENLEACRRPARPRVVDIGGVILYSHCSLKYAQSGGSSSADLDANSSCLLRT